MKALSVLGTSSNAGKSWLATALCAWLRRQGVRVAPFKAQNMSNNAFATLEGGEMGRAQAVQAAACGLRPVAAMNPILLKPCGQGRSQLVLLGEARETLAARDYYQHIDRLWDIVATTLDDWGDRCDVLVMEGAGSPVELNLMHRDLVNLRPVAYLDGRWLLVADIERGGVFAQAVGTWALLPPGARTRGLGLVVNKFRGDLALFADAGDHFAKYMRLPYLGTLPYCPDLQPESEDSLCREAEEGSIAPATPGENQTNSDTDWLAWIRWPHLANSQDSQPWRLDRGVVVRWVDRPEDLAGARAIVLPGTKNTIADLRWLRETGLDRAILRAAAAGRAIVGICGGYQILGQHLADPEGWAGDRGEAAGLGLLPLVTEFQPAKVVRPVLARWPGQDDLWQPYEIHAGQTTVVSADLSEADRPLLSVCDLVSQGRELASQLPISPGASWRDEGWQRGHIWGTYLHGLFEATAVRQDLARLAGCRHHQAGERSWQDSQTDLYDRMADLVVDHVNLDGVRRYLGL